jgi:short-subunit dehydrogenase
VVRPPLDGGTVLLTGASSGIGLELARQLAPRTGKLVLVARRADRLEALKTELAERCPRCTVFAEPCDLAETGSIAAMLDRVAASAGDVDVLINNAGHGHYGPFDRSDWAQTLSMIQVNIVALTLLTHRLVPPMVARGRGGVCNIGSGAGLATMPGSAVYTGTKHFVDGFTETLALELAGTGVAVTQVCPGPIDTEFAEVAGIGDTSRSPMRLLKISAEQCAREAIRGFERGQPLVFPGAAYRLLMTFQMVTPRWLQRIGARPLVEGLRR